MLLVLTIYSAPVHTATSPRPRHIQHQPLPSNPHLRRLPTLQFPPNNPIRQFPSNLHLYQAIQRSRAISRVIPLLTQPVLHICINIQSHPPVIEPRLQLPQPDVYDIPERSATEFVEDDELVDAVEEFGSVRGLHDVHDGGLCLGCDAVAGAVACGADEDLGAKVAGQDDDGVAEIDFMALSVGQKTFV